MCRSLSTPKNAWGRDGTMPSFRSRTPISALARVEASRSDGAPGNAWRKNASPHRAPRGTARWMAAADN
jgi:hypothetical protein